MLDMSFLTANFGWILLAVVLFAMLIVGYVADKTDFGHKKISKKKEIENPNKVEEIDLENLKGKTLKDMVGGSNEEKEAKDINEDLNAPFGDNVDSSNEEAIDSSLYTPIGGEDLNIPFGDTNESTDIPLDIDLATPISDTTKENKEESENNNVVEEVKEVSEDNQSIDELIPEVKIDNIPETEEIVTPITEENKTEEPVVEEPIFEVPTIEEPVNEETVTSENLIIDEPVVENPVENLEDVSLASMDDAIPSLDTEEVLIPSIDEVPTENVEVPVEPLVEEAIDTPIEEEKSKKKKDKKEKKKHKKEDSNKYTADYEEEIVPEVITEKFDDGSEISSDDDIWKF